MLGMVGAAGLELAASWSQTRRSSQLSYAPMMSAYRCKTFWARAQALIV